MRLVKKEFEKDGSGWLKLVPTEAEDMWHAYNLIAEGDTLTTTTTRKVKSESSTGSVDTKKVRCDTVTTHARGLSTHVLPLARRCVRLAALAGAKEKSLRVLCLVHGTRAQQLPRSHWLPRFTIRITLGAHNADAQSAWCRL